MSGIFGKKEKRILPFLGNGNVTVVVFQIPNCGYVLNLSVWFNRKL